MTQPSFLNTYLSGNINLQVATGVAKIKYKLPYAKTYISKYHTEYVFFVRSILLYRKEKKKNKKNIERFNILYLIVRFYEITYFSNKSPRFLSPI